MIGAIARRVFGTANERYLKSLRAYVEAANALEPALEVLSDDALRGRTPWLRERLEAGESLDEILVEAFATVREAAKRTLGQRHFDVQILGGVVLHRGQIAEMKTGEGKTLVATLPVYLNALKGAGVHVVTVNDYLARRDVEWMGEIYGFLGLSSGCIVHGLSDDERRKRLRRRRHLRHQQRVRLRLFARQHEVPPRRHGPAALQLRDRRRGRFDPHRRGAHAPDHLGPGRGFVGPLQSDRQADPQARGRGFRKGREGPRGHLHRDRHRAP